MPKKRIFFNLIEFSNIFVEQISCQKEKKIAPTCIKYIFKHEHLKHLLECREENLVTGLKVLVQRNFNKYRTHRQFRQFCTIHHS